MGVLEQTLSGLSGTSVDSSIQIPDRSILLGVSTRTATTVTVATSYDCGIVGETDKFGGALGVAAGSTSGSGRNVGSGMDQRRLVPARRAPSLPDQCCQIPSCC